MVENKLIELKVDCKRFEAVFKALMKDGRRSQAGEVETVLMAMCLSEVCWKAFSERASGQVGNLGEFRSELKLASVKFAEEVFKV